MSELNLEYVSKPAYCKAIEFKADGSNYQEILDIIRLNGGVAEEIYTDKDGVWAGPGKITIYKGVAIYVDQTTTLAVPRGTYIIIEDGMPYPMGKKDFLERYVTLENVNDISNGQHSFKQLYRELSRYEPTLEQCIVADKFHLSNEKPEVAEFIRQTSMHHIDSMHKTYYVLHGTVYVD